MAVALILATTLVSVAGVRTGNQGLTAAGLQWAGTLTFNESSLHTVDAPLNVTLNAATVRGNGTAAFDWYFTSERCRSQAEPTLEWSIDSSSGLFTALGTGIDPLFYSFQGRLNENTGKISGLIYPYHPPFADKLSCGTFTIAPVSENNPYHPPQCTTTPIPPPSPSPGKQSRNPAMWPAPARLTVAPDGAGAVAIIDAPALVLSCSGNAEACSHSGEIMPAFIRAKQWAFHVPGANTTGAKLTTLVVVVTDTVPLQLGVNESYTLEVNATHATITAPTQWGVLYGIETFFQLVLIEPWEECAMCDKYIVKEDVPFMISDRPRVPWRGLMIDSGRHYLPPPLIKKTIDAMAASKMNALHWHLTDDQSFPLCLDSHPELCKLSQYRSRVDGSPQNYTSVVIHDIVAYATARGVRVVPELDLPGHSAGLQRGAPSLYVNCSSSDHPLPDPTTDGFFDLVDSIVAGLAVEFPDAFLHMGGDEVDTSCWTDNKAVVQWMHTKNLTAMGVLGYFQMRIQEIVQKHGRRAMFWDEFWSADLPALNSTTAEIRGTTFSDSLSAGRQTLTTGINEAWYLDHGISNPRFVQMDWQPLYTHDPFQGLDDEQLQFVLGGEVDMWGEGVDETNFEARVFPWASAVAERLWSPAAQSSSTEEAETRLSEFRCLLVGRGVNAAPIGPGAPC
eukprot:m.169924 g.169924  ORF g.169924 m.169924 type:complete len:677 (-) comp31597_c0_seq1:8-2038(-)